MHLSSGGGPSWVPRLGPGRSAGQPVWHFPAATDQVPAAVHHPTSVVPQRRVHLQRRPGIEHALPAIGSAAGQPPAVDPTPSGGTVAGAALLADASASEA